MVGARSEQEFKQILRIELGRALPCVRLWPQPAGQIGTNKGTWVTCAPVGAADLSGIVSPEGWRLEVETKGHWTRDTPEHKRAQDHWRKTMQRFGAVALLVRDDGTPEAVAHAVEAIRSAVEARRCRRS